jgi:hypothetical protein
MREGPWSAKVRRAEARLRTGAAAHLLGGGLDLLEAVARHLLARIERRRRSHRR